MACSLDRLGPAALLVAGGASLFAETAGTSAPLPFAIAGFAVFAVAEWRRALPQGRLFLILGVISAAALALAGDAMRPTLAVATRQSLTFTALLVALGLLRPPMRGSRLVQRAAAWLLARPPRQRYAAVTFGSHVLSVLFNVGILQLIGEVLHRAGLECAGDRRARALLLAAMRGSTTMPLWSPMAMGFAVVSTTLPGFSPPRFMLIGVGVAVVLLLYGCWIHRAEGDGDSGSDGAATLAAMPMVAGGGAATALLLAGALATLATALALHLVLHLAFGIAATWAVAGAAVAWRLLEPAAAGAAREALWSRLTELRTEMFIFAASTMIGAAVVQVIGHVAPGLTTLSDGAIAPLACLFGIPVLAAAAVPPSIPVLLAAQILAALPSASGHAASFALALIGGWSLGMVTSPISATVLIAGNVAGVPARTIMFDWNRAHGIGSAAILAAAVAGLHLAGW